MKRRMITLLKNNRILYKIYYYVMSTLLKIFGLFISNKNNEMLFVCYGGRKYGDNVRPIYEYLLNDNRFTKWKFIWAFRDVDQFELPDSRRTIKCKIDSLDFFYYALHSKCWITNVSIQRGLNFKKRGTLYINTWHGVPLKLIGEDIRQNSSFKAEKTEKFDCFFAAGNYDAKIIPSAYRIQEDYIFITGYPRNDCMFRNKEHTKEKIYGKYNIPKDKKIILYAPTYRDYNKDREGNFVFDLKLSSVIYSEEGLSEDYVLLVRAHGAIEESNNSNGFIDVTGYPDIEDLLVACDVLVSDFSGVIFDYALLYKPIFCFLYDLNTYREKRGFYVDIESFLPFKKCYAERELYQSIKEMDYSKECTISREFVSKCGLVRNNATNNAVNQIALLLNIQ